MRLQEVQRFIRNVLASSILVAPDEYGVTPAELVEIGASHGFGPGEIQDALRVDAGIDRSRMGPNLIPTSMVTNFLLMEPTEGRAGMPSAETLDYVVRQFQEVAKEKGARSARLSGDVLGARGEGAGHTKRDVQVALALFELNGNLKDEGDGSLSNISLQIMQPFVGRTTMRNPILDLTSVYGTVRDVIARRASDRPASADPLRAFPEELAALGHANLREWWHQVASELDCADSQQSPVSVVVLSAALCEAALTVVIGRSKELELAMRRLPERVEQWQLSQLIEWAKSGSDPIIQGDLGAKCKKLNEWRQRIHVARYLEATPAQVSCRTDEARQAKNILAELVRAVLEWLDRTRDAG